jgi:hypothetical protein
MFKFIIQKTASILQKVKSLNAKIKSVITKIDNVLEITKEIINKYKIIYLFISIFVTLLLVILFPLKTAFIISIILFILSESYGIYRKGVNENRIIAEYLGFTIVILIKTLIYLF